MLWVTGEQGPVLGAGEPPPRVLPDILEVAAAFDRPPFREVGDRVVAEDRQALGILIDPLARNGGGGREESGKDQAMQTPAHDLHVEGDHCGISGEPSLCRELFVRRSPARSYGRVLPKTWRQMPAEPTEAKPEGTAHGRRRKLAAILSADAVGFSRQMHRDEAGTYARLQSCREIIDRLVAGHEGRIVGSAGDSVLADFPSVVEALSWAVEIQRALREHNTALPPDHQLEFRVGINLGDVIIHGDDIYGDGINVAARLQQLAEPGGILV